MLEKNDYRVHFAFFFLCIAWGTTYLGIRVALNYFQPFMLAGLRHVIAGSIFLAICFWRKESLPSVKDILRLTLIGILLVVGGNALVCWAEQYIPSGLTAVICSFSPIYITIMSLFFFKGFRVTPKIVLGLALGLSGIVVIFFKDLGLIYDKSTNIALLLIIIANLCWGLGTILVKKTQLGLSLFMTLGVQMFTAGCINCIISFLLEDNNQLIHTELNGILSLAYLIIVGSLTGYSCYLYVLSKYAPARVSLHTYINTIIAVLVGWLIGGETITSFMVLGTLIVLLGVLLVNREYTKLSKSV